MALLNNMKIGWIGPNYVPPAELTDSTDKILWELEQAKRLDCHVLHPAFPLPKDDPEALRFIRQCLEVDQRGARKIKEVTDDGGVVSAYYQLLGKDPDVNRFVLFKVNSKGTITLVYIEGELDSDDLITLLFTKKDL